MDSNRISREELWAPTGGMCLRSFAFKHFPSVYLKHLYISCFLNGFKIL